MSEVDTQTDSLSYRGLISKAWPLVLANASVPLLGLVDTAVIGNTGTTIDLGAIAFGSLIFGFVYWTFGFLRMGTTGFIAQAYGANNQLEIRAILGRGFVMALVLGLSLLLSQQLIGTVSFSLLEGSSQVESVAAEYFFIRIWGAPATLCLFVVMGVWVGLGESRELLRLQLLLNGLNIVLDVLFAGVFGWGAQGIAVGTLIAELVCTSYGVWRLLQFLGFSRTAFWPWEQILSGAELKRSIAANTDIMIRTLLLVYAFALFTNRAAIYGDVSLAATHVLMQIVAFTAFFLDGYAYVAESLVGRAIGAKDRLFFNIAVVRTTVLAAVTALVLAAVVWLCGDFFIYWLTDIEEVQEQAVLMIWAVSAYVLLSFPAFQLDGIFIGASATKAMRDASVLSLLVYLVCVYGAPADWGLGALWGAMVIFVIARALALLVYTPSTLRRAFAA